MEKDLLSAIAEFGIEGVAASKKREDPRKLDGYIQLILCLLAVRMERLRFYGGVSDFGDVTEKNYQLTNKLRCLINEPMQKAKTPLELLKNMKGELCAVIKSANKNKLLEDDGLGDLRGVLRKI